MPKSRSHIHDRQLYAFCVHYKANSASTSPHLGHSEQKQYFYFPAPACHAPLAGIQIKPNTAFKQKHIYIYFFLIQSILILSSMICCLQNHRINTFYTIFSAILKNIKFHSSPTWGPSLTITESRRFQVASWFSLWPVIEHHTESPTGMDVCSLDLKQKKSGSGGIRNNAKEWSNTGDPQ